MDSVKSMLGSSLAIPLGLVGVFYILNFIAGLAKLSPRSDYYDIFVDTLGYGSTITLVIGGIPYLKKIDSGDMKLIFVVGIGVFLISAATGFVKSVKAIFKKKFEGEKVPEVIVAKPKQSASNSPYDKLLE